MYEQLKRRAGMLATVVALTAVILAALPGAAEAQEEEGTHEDPTSNSLPAPDAPTNQVVIAPGDSLWTIAQGHLGPDATPQQVANEVERIFELNRARIGDNPDLILAGQELSLAPVSGPLGTVPEPEPVVVAGPVAAAANEQPVAEEQPAAEERSAAAGRDVEQREEPKQLSEASPTQEDASTVSCRPA